MRTHTTAQNEDFLLRIARHGTASHVEKVVGKYKSANALQLQAPAVTSDTCVFRWRGESCDYQMAVEALLRKQGKINGLL